MRLNDYSLFRNSFPLRFKLEMLFYFLELFPNYINFIPLFRKCSKLFTR
jgi:hypothetical protein